MTVSSFCNKTGVDNVTFIIGMLQPHDEVHVNAMLFRYEMLPCSQ